MSDELAKLQADLEVLERYWDEGRLNDEHVVPNLKDKIASLEAAAAAPWREAKAWIESCRVSTTDSATKRQVAYVDHLTAENADLKQKYDLANSTIETATERLNETKAERDRLAARVAELENEPESANVTLRRADEIELGDLIVTIGEIRIVDSIVKNAEKFKVQLCSGGWGSWFEPSGLVAVVNSVIPYDPAKPGEDRTVRTIKYVDGGPLKPRDVSDEMNELLGDDDPVLDPARRAK